MTGEMWKRARPILGDALALPADRRGQFIEAACGSDAPLRAALEALVKAAEGSLLPEPAAEGAAGVALPDVPSMVAVGTRVGQYRLKRLIGAGGMGAVYEAVQEHPRRTVAVKVLRAGLTSRSAERRFEYEAQLLGRLKHPGVAQIFEAGIHATEAGAMPFFAMEYIAGAKPITDYCRERELDLRGRIGLFTRVCEAVHHGHQKGIVHRDLKPTNILVDSGGGPRIIDFGVARATDSDLALTTFQTEVGQLVGTLQYMSPEQCAADPHDLDTRSDVYSLGVVLYELLTGQLPYKLTGVSVLQAPQIIREQPPVRPSAVNPLLRGDLQIITLKALAKDRSQRYQSAGELAGDLQRYVEGEPISARPPSIGYQLRLLARRRKGLVAGAAAVLAGALVGLAGLSLGLASAVKERDKARRTAAFLESMIGAGAMVHREEEDEGDPLAEVALGARAEPAGAARDYSVPELLSRSAERLDAVFAADPLERAHLQDMIGTALSQYGREGRPLLERSLETRRALLGPDDEETVGVTLRLATIIHGAGGFVPAEPLFRAAYESRRRTLGEADPRTLHAGRLLVESLGWLGRGPEGLALARRLRELALARHGEGSPAGLEMLSLLASEVLRSGDLDEGERLARRAAEGYRTLTGADSPATVRAGSLVAWVLEVTDRGGEALPMRRAEVAVCRARYGPDSARVQGPEQALAESLSAAGEGAEAASVQRGVVERTRRLYGAESNAVYRQEFFLSRVLTRAGAELPEAERLAVHALAGQRRAFAPGDGICILYAAQVATAARVQGRGAEAERSLRELIPLAESEGNWGWFLHRELGLSLLEQGRGAEAAVALRRSLGMVEEQKPVHRRNRREVAADLARAEAAMRQPEPNPRGGE